MGNVISSAIFSIRSADKAEKQLEAGHGATAASRAVIAGGQLWKVGEYVAEKTIKLDNELGKTTQTAVNILRKASKNDALIDYAGKAVKWASKSVNPLICVSSGIDVLSSEDKQSTLIKNGSALGGMFFIEGQMKKVVDETTKQQALDKVLIGVKNKALKSKTFGKITKNLLKFAESHGGKNKYLQAAHGITFVLGSITGYTLGEKFGTTVAKGVKKIQGEENAQIREKQKTDEVAVEKQ